MSMKKSEIYRKAAIAAMKCDDMDYEETLCVVEVLLEDMRLAAFIEQKEEEK
jgi:hypothetical protein